MKHQGGQHTLSDSDTLSQAEIDSLLATLSSGLDEESIDDSGERKGYKLYNFRRPDKFSKDHLRALQTIHDGFSRQLGLVLTSYLRMQVDVDVVSVDQLTYDEFVRSMPNPITVSIIELLPLPGQILMGMGHEVTSGIIDRMLGGLGVSETRPRELTDIEESLIRRVIDKTIKALEEAWNNVIPIEASLVGMEDNYILIQVATPGEIVALITFEVQMGGRDSGLMSLCLPYPVLESVISQLSAQHIFHSRGHETSEEDRNKLIQKLGAASMHVNVSLGNVDLSVRELLELRSGDVLRLDSMVNDPLVVSVEGIPKFKGRPGTIKNKIALNIVDTITVENLDSVGVDLI